MYEYRAELVKVIDGDTIDVKLDLGFKLTYGIRIRLKDIDTPELRSKDEEERKRALEAKQLVTELLEDKDLLVRTSLTSKGEERRTFGRYVAEVYFKSSDAMPGDYVSLVEVLQSRGY